MQLNLQKDLKEGYIMQQRQQIINHSFVDIGVTDDRDDKYANQQLETESIHFEKKKKDSKKNSVTDDRDDKYANQQLETEPIHFEKKKKESKKKKKKKKSKKKILESESELYAV